MDGYRILSLLRILILVEPIRISYSEDYCANYPENELIPVKSLVKLDATDETHYEPVEVINTYDVTNTFIIAYVDGVSSGTSLSTIDCLSTYNYNTNASYIWSIVEFVVNDFNPNPIQSVNVTVEFYVSPKLDTIKTDVVVEESNVALNCTSTGNPPPTLQWITQDGEEHFTEEEFSINPPIAVDDISSILQIRISNASLFDSGNYSCVGNSTAVDGTRLESSSNVGINIQSAVISLNSSTDDVKINGGENVTIWCEFQGNPTPNVSWSITGNNVFVNEITNVEEYTVSSYLTLVDVTCDQDGDVNCIAENILLDSSQHEVTRSITLNLISPGEVVGLHMSVDECLGNKLHVEWKVPLYWKGEISYETCLNSTQCLITNDTFAIFENLTLGQVYEAQVRGISKCNKTGKVSTQSLSTSNVSSPSDPTDIKGNSINETCWCNLTWNSLAQEDSAGTEQEVLYQTTFRAIDRNDITKIYCEETFTTNATEMNYKMCSSFSTYSVAVTALNCEGQNDTATFEKTNCTTDAAPPESISQVVIQSTSKSSTVPESGFLVDVTEEPSDYGTISCYFVVLVRICNGETIVPTFKNTKMANKSSCNTPYYEHALNKPQNNVKIGKGDDSITWCMASTNTNITASSVKLIPGASYAMYKVVAVPSIDQDDTTYWTVSDPYDFSVETDGLLGWAIALIVIAACVVVVIIVLLFIFYEVPHKISDWCDDWSSVSNGSRDMSMDNLPSKDSSSG